MKNNIVKKIPLDGVVLVVSVAVDGGAEVIRHVPQLVGLVPECQYFILHKRACLINLPLRAHPEHISLVTIKLKELFWLERLCSLRVIHCARHLVVGPVLYCPEDDLEDGAH